MTEVTHESPSTATQAKEKVQETVQQGAEQVRGQVQQTKGQVGQRVREQVDTRSTQVGEQTQSVAEATRRITSQLRNEGNEAPAKVLDGVANQAERVGGYLQESDSDRILRDVEDFARRQPWVMALVGGLIGFAASRFLKASSGNRYRQSGDGRYGYTPGYTGGYTSPATRDFAELETPGIDVGPATPQTGRATDVGRDR